MTIRNRIDTGELVNPFALIPLQIAGCILVADFLSGLFHWLEDSYGQTHWPILGKAVIEPNLKHHSDPRAMTKNSWWKSADLQVLLGGVYLALRWLMNALTWRKALVVSVLVNANEIHKWAHRNPKENGRVITWLQKHHIVQSPRQHGQHHRGLKNSAYCTLTDHLNPLLDRLRFWVRIEVAVYKMFGVRRRLDRAWIERMDRIA